MAKQTIIEEYLVRLGFAPTDTVGLARFQASLKDISSSVDNTFFKVGKSVLGFQVGVTSAFAGVASAALGIAGKVANADQEYRLLALHMQTSLPVARELKVALDALGQPLENVIWDKELAGRFHQLVLDQQTMTKGLGSDFESTMVKIRDVVFEFQRFGAIVENYLIPLVVKDLAQAFGTNIDEMLGKFRNFNDWLVANLPAIAEWIANTLKPILIDAYNVLLSTFHLLVQIGGQLKNVDWGAFIGDIAKAVIGLAKLEGNLVSLFAAAVAAGKGHFGEAVGDLRDMKSFDFMNKITGQADGDFSQASPLTGAGRGLTTPEAIKAEIIRDSKLLGLSPDLALAVAQRESGFSQFDSAGNVLMAKTKPGQAPSHATGIFQLQPGTARDMGVDPNDAGGNILGGVKYLLQMLNKYGNEGDALRHYYGGGKADTKNREDYVRGVLANEANIHVEVNVSTNANPSEIANQTARAVTNAQKNKVQRNLLELNSADYSY